MPVQTKTFVVDGDEYEITQLGAKKGRKLWLKLVHVMSAPMRELGSSDKLNEQTILTALAAAIDNLDDETTEALYEAYGETCTVRNPETGNCPNLTGPIFDQHFAGKYMSMTKWLWECTSFNFASFLGGTSLGSLKDLLVKKMAASQSGSPKGSTGSSGES